MGASDLDDTCKFAAFFIQRIGQPMQRGQQAQAQSGHDGHMQRGGNHIVARLAGVGVVVGMHHRHPISSLPQQLAGTPGKHLIHVHVGLRARTGLPNRQRKFIGMMPLQHLIGSLLQGFGHGRIQPAQAGIGARACMFDLCQRMQKLWRHPFSRNRKIVQRALRLRTPKALCRHVNTAQTVVFDPIFHIAPS